MSGHDIDSTSENVLRDWEDGESPVEEPVAEPTAADGDGEPAWGATPVAETEEPSPPAEATEIATHEPAESEDAPEEIEPPAEAEVDESPRRWSSPRSTPRATAIPDGCAVLEGVSEGGRRAVGVVVSRFNGKVTTQLLDGALAELAEAGAAQRRSRSVVPGARLRSGDGAREDAPLRVHRCARLRDPGDSHTSTTCRARRRDGLQLAALETGIPSGSAC